MHCGQMWSTLLRGEKVKILADECVDRQIVDRLRQDGHTVLYVAEMEPGISDQEVLNLVNQEEAILLTADKDFGELVFRQDRVAPGIVLVRLAGLSAAIKEDIIADAIEDHLAEFLQSFTVIMPDRVRIRRKIFYD